MLNGTEDAPGFDQLVSEISKDIRPRAVLDEWLRQEIITQQDDLIALNQDALVPDKDFDKMCDYFGKHIHDHLASSIHNLLGDGESMFERSVYYKRLTPESIEQLKQMATEQGDQLLQNLNQQAIQLYERERDDPAAIHRFRMGCYWYDEEIEK